MDHQYSEEFLNFCKSITAKRPKIVIEHILQCGYITTEELKEQYGYNHPPRAVRDVREYGIPVETFRITGKNGRKIAAYRFGNTSKKQFSRLSGRTSLSKKIKEYLIHQYGSKCFIYLETMNENELQIDHRIPYGIGGDTENPELHPEDFMLLSGSANRAKSWSCEHCENWKILKDKSFCLSCYWAFPENYLHIAMRQVRRTDLIWQGQEVEKYEKLKVTAQELGQDIPKFIKELIEKFIEQK